MYAQRFDTGPRFRPASLGAAIAINGGVIAGLLLTNPEWIPGPKPSPPIEIINIDPPKPTPTEEPKQKVEPRPRPTATTVTPRREVDTHTPTTNTTTGTEVIGNPSGPGPGPIAGTGDGPIDLPLPPVFVAATQDPRYLSDFQPPYPDYERDAGREGVVKLRVRIGVDGRVKQVERISGRDSFARVAIAQALAKWRFRPATRGGVPEESWQVMTLRFTLND